MHFFYWRYFMNVCKLLKKYVSYRRSLGEKFITTERYLKLFCRKTGVSKDIKFITENDVNSFLYSNEKTITSGWFCRHTALLGFYRYAFTRGYVNKIPLPSVLPKRPKKFVPYIYSKDELKLIFKNALLY